MPGAGRCSVSKTATPGGPMRHRLLVVVLLAGPVLFSPRSSHAACCYFAARDKDVTQPAQKAFITWDPAEKLESFTVQPKFEGNAQDFGMVVPTPARPKLDEMPRDFFKELAVFTILKKREYPESKLVPRPVAESAAAGAGAQFGPVFGAAGGPRVRVLEAGVVGSLDYKIIQADRADDLYAW